MKFFILILSAFISSAAIFAQSVSTREITKIDHFDKIILASGINLTIRKADKTKITIKGERTVIASVVCQVDDGELNIYTTRFKYKKTKRIDIIMDVDSALTSIYATSGNKVRCETVLPCKSLTLIARYGSDFFFNINADYIKAKAEEGSDIRLVGEARKADFFATNACSIRAFQMKADIASIAAQQSSNVDITVLSSLIVSSSSNCEIRYKGDPQFTQINALNGSRALPVENETL